jgi:hypothetical protein
MLLVALYVYFYNAGVVNRSRRIGAWGRCNDHNFMRFLPIFGEKIGVFFKKNNVMKIFIII